MTIDYDIEYVTVKLYRRIDWAIFLRGMWILTSDSVDLRFDTFRLYYVVDWAIIVRDVWLLAGDSVDVEFDSQTDYIVKLIDLY